MSLCNAEKICVIGNSGAGKSTFSNKLAKVLAKDVFSIDKIYWLPGWSLRNERSFNRLHNEWLKLDSWIIDGVGYWDEMERRINESDIIIFLDMPVSLCKKRAAARILEDQLTPGHNIAVGCAYSEVEDMQMDAIDIFHNELRPRLLRYISRLNSEKLIVINSGEQLELFDTECLNNLSKPT